MDKSYEKGKRWGYAIFRQNVDDFGELGIAKSDKASRTCSKYLKENKRQGKALQNPKRIFSRVLLTECKSFITSYKITVPKIRNG